MSDTLWDWRVVRPKPCTNYVLDPSFEATALYGTSPWTLASGVDIDTTSPGSSVCP